MDGRPYHVMAPDGRQYGPLSLALVEQWVLAKRITLASLAWTHGEKDWRPLAQIIPRSAPIAAGALSPTQQAFLTGLSRYLTQEGYDVGEPSDGADSRNTALALKAGFAIAKFAIGHLTGQRVYGTFAADGAAASQATVRDVASNAIAAADLFALRNDFRHGAGVMVAVLGDSLSEIEILARVEYLRDQSKRLREFAIAVNRERNIVVRTLLLYCNPATYESHRRVLPLIGYECRHESGGWVTSLVSLVDVTRKAVDHSTMGGFLGGLQRMTGIKPFGPKDLASTLALA